MKIALPKNFGKTMERLLRSTLEAALLEEIRKRVEQASRRTDLGASSRRSAVIAGLRGDRLIDGIPDHLVNLAIEMAVAELKARP